MARDLQRIIDADYEVVGSYRTGEEHRTRKGWYFTGRHDAQGYPLFRRSKIWFEARALMWLAVWILGGLAVMYPLQMLVRLATGGVS